MEQDIFNDSVDEGNVKEYEQAEALNRIDEATAILKLMTCTDANVQLPNETFRIAATTVLSNVETARFLVAHL